jgi:YD repeat-containing protein
LVSRPRPFRFSCCTTQFDYDPSGNVISVTDPASRTTTTTTYDELNRPVRIVGPQYTDATLGTIRSLTSYTYNPLGHLIKVEAGHTNGVTDTVTPQMTYLYDDFGRKIRETDALSRSWSFEYDINNNPITVTDAKGQLTTFTYGYGHQLLARAAGGQTTSWSRNPLGQVTQAQSPDVTYTPTYDAAHRLTSVTETYGCTLHASRFEAILAGPA